MIGQGFVSGSAIDKSGLTGVICQEGVPANCVSKAILGGFGSDVTYTGHDNVFVAAPDRGPFDGLTHVPYLDRFDFFTSLPRLARLFQTFRRFAIANPSSNPNAELLGNTAGRQANRGMEGLAISPDGSTLFGIMQNALIQDNGLEPGETDRLGLNNRILKMNLSTGETQEYVYVLDAINRGQGVCEILAINDHEFLVIERDNRSNLQSPPQAPTRKKIYKIDLNGATDVSGINSLPAGVLPAGIVPVTKTLFIDLLAPEFNLIPTIAEKIEGLAWGPDLEDGRHVLYVFSDNDLNPALASQIYSFAIDSELIDLEHQFLPGPLVPPGQVKKAVRSNP